MPRKVEGFLTADGTFYDNSDEADLHDAYQALDNSIEDFMNRIGLSAEFRREVKKLALEFIKHDMKGISEYIEAVSKLTPTAPIEESNDEKEENSEGTETNKPKDEG